ncbi:MAG: hypothetical protein GTO18_11135 [Anaerolineales bacterium]|nr:hypothetical protein [Anaerolineales bacterium]
MERVAFLVEETNERLECLLNPESLEIRRVAGVRSRTSAGGKLTGVGIPDDPILYTGGGRSELKLDLLFDVNLSGSTIASDDVRDLTAPLWNLAENAQTEGGYGRPPMVRLVWGKSWNIPGIVAAVAERLEHFTSSGAPQRSWLRMKFIQVRELVTRPSRESRLMGNGSVSLEELQSISESSRDQIQVHEFSSVERLDEIAFHRYGSSAFWRLIAELNGIDNPMDVSPGTLLNMP